MGVRGLLSTCLKDTDACTETYDLVQVAKQKGKLELIVDFNSFKHHILSKFWKGLSKLRDNDYLRFLGGEYSSLDKYVTKLVEDLKSLNIHLVFYIDGDKGSSIEGFNQKRGTWKERHGKDIEKMSQIFDVLWWETEISKLSCDTNINPVLLDDQLIATLRSCDCEIHQSPAGEADLLIIRALRDRKPKAFAILSRDSDFCVFKESRLIPDELFDFGNDLKLGEPRELPEKPRKLIVKVISTEKVMAMLKLEEHGLLVEMSIVAGNDYTRPFMQDYIRQKKYNGDFEIPVRGGPNIRNYARWIKEHIEADRHPYLKICTKKNPDFRQAVIHSRNSYNLRGEPDKCPDKGDFSRIIEERIRSGQYPCNIMSMHNNFYWYRMILEHMDPCAERALTPLRAYLYRIVLPMEEKLVNEHGRSPDELKKAQVIAIDGGRAPPLHKIKPDRTVENLQTFHRIWSHQEKGKPTGAAVNWFGRYGRKIGFVVYILRYFLLLNWQRNLDVTEDEFLALVAMVIGPSSEERYQRIAIRPTIRCVTIINWMQDVYRHGYQMFGSVLYIRREFPLPSELFSGSVWTAMYMVSKDKTFQDAARQLSSEKLDQIDVEKTIYVRENYGVLSDVLDRIKNEKNTIIRKNHDMIADIVQGVFSLDDVKL